MAIILTLKNEGTEKGHDNILIESKFSEDESWFKIQEMFYRHLYALGYRFTGDRIIEHINELAKNGEFE